MSDYTSQILGAAPTPDNTAVFSMQMAGFDKQLRKLSKRKRSKKKSQKKLKKRIRALEQENQQLQQLVLFVMYQQGQTVTVQPQRPPWWQETLRKSLPKALELATVSVSKLPSRSQSILALPEAQGRK